VTILEKINKVVLLVVNVISSVNIKKAVNKLIFVQNNVIIVLNRLLYKTISYFSQTFLSLYTGVVTIWGATPKSTFYAIQRVRQSVLVKIRTIFANRGNFNG
jgi:fumarate reductase subunit C